MTKTTYSSQHFQVYLDPQKAWELIEYKTMGYEREMDELYPDNFISERTSIVHRNTLEPELLEGEQYMLLEGMCEGYAITSYGRIFNCVQLKQITIYFSAARLSVSIRGIKIDFVAEFAKHEWEFDIDTIKRRYNENKWIIKDKNNIILR